MNPNSRGEPMRPARLSRLERPCFEPLEARRMLALTIITPDEALAFPDWAYDMGTAIIARDGLYDRRDADDNGVVDVVQNARVNLFGTVEPVGAGQAARDLVLYDWMIGSDTPGTANEMAGDLVEWIVGRLETVPRQEMHFIGHGRGALVNMEVLRQLAQHPLAGRIGFVQMTTLDPYARGADGVIEYNPGGLVDFADNYYQDSAPEQLEHGGPILGALNFHLNEQLAAWNGRTGTLADHHEVHDWYHWTIDSATIAADAPELVDTNLPVPTSEDRAALYDDFVADLDHNNAPDEFGGGAYIGYYFSVAGGGIGKSNGAHTVDVTRRTLPLFLGQFLDTERFDLLQGIGYAPNGDLYAIINAAASGSDPDGLYRIQFHFDANNQPVAERTFVGPVPVGDLFEYPFEFKSDGKMIAGAPGGNLQTMERWDLLEIDPASGLGTPAYHVDRLPWTYPLSMAVDHADNVFFTTTLDGSKYDLVRVDESLDSDTTLSPPPSNLAQGALSVIDGLLYGADFDGNLYSLNLVTGQFLERGLVTSPFDGLPASLDHLTSVHSLRQPRWHNRSLAPDVDGNGRVNSTDVLIVINTLLVDGARAPASSELFAQYYDVTNDGRFNTSDLLAVINHILLSEELSAPAAAEPLAAPASFELPNRSPLDWIAFASTLADDDEDEAEFW